MFQWKVVSALSVALLTSVAVAPAQISVGIGVAPACPYGYYDYAPYNCAPYGYYGPDWFTGGVFIGAGPGSMARMAFTDTWITGSIRATGTMGRFRSTESGLSIISTGTRPGTVTVTSAMPDTIPGVNTQAGLRDMALRTVAADTDKFRRKISEKRPAGPGRSVRC